MIIDTMLVHDRVWAAVNLTYDVESFRPWSGGKTEEASVGGISAGVTARDLIFADAEFRQIARIHDRGILGREHVAPALSDDVLHRLRGQCQRCVARRPAVHGPCREGAGCRQRGHHGGPARSGAAHQALERRALAPQRSDSPADWIARAAAVADRPSGNRPKQVAPEPDMRASKQPA